MSENPGVGSNQIKPCKSSYQDNDARSINTSITSNPFRIIEIINDQETENFKLGILLILVAVTTWIVGLELVNSVLKGDDYKKPFMFSFITGSCFVLNFTPDVFNFIKQKIYRNSSDKSEMIEHIDTTSEMKEEFTRKEILVLAAQMSVIYNLYNISVMLSLQYTSASNQTVLGTMTSIFTLFIGIYLKIDVFSLKKLLCILVSTTGVFLINFSDGKSDKNNEGKFQPKNPRLGNTLALTGALLYAFYLILMKVRCGMGNRSTNERQLFGFVGLFSIIFSFPSLYLVHYFNLETFEFPPPSNNILIAVLTNGIFSVISDYSTIIAMLLTSPLVTSLSLTSAIPITIFIDYIVMTFSGTGSPNSSYIYFLGIASIIVSVVLINVNITSENELIGEVIDSVLEEVIREDEVLSPILSPLMGRTPVDSLNNSPYFQPDKPIHKGLNGSALLASLTPKLISKAKSPLSINESKFNLNETTESPEAAPLYNKNHSSELYTISKVISSKVNSKHDKMNFVVYSDSKHRYHITTLDSNDPDN